MTLNPSRAGTVLAAALACGLLPAQLRGEPPARDLALPLDRWDPPQSGTRADVVRAGPHGEPCLRLAVSAVSWQSQLHRTLAYSRAIARVVFEGSYRAENVIEGASPEARVRAMLAFVGEGGRVGDWPPASKIAGTTEWQGFRQELVAPPGAFGVQLMIGPTLTTGTAYFNGLRVTAFDRDGVVIEPLASPFARTDTSRWWVFAPGREDTTRPLVLDPAIHRLPPPTETGWVKAKGDRLVFEKTGQEVRFWGTNIMGEYLFQSAADGEALVARLERLGFNMIRLHHVDAPWTPSIFADGDTTQAFDAQRLDRLDRLVALAGRHGMRVYLDLMATRKFRKGDGVSDWKTLGMGAKVACHFDRRIIDLHKQFARDFLTHVNPHTGLRYADDPTIVMMEIVNESSLFWVSGHDALPAHYQQELDGLYADWCARNSVAKPRESVRALLRANDPDVCRFLLEVQDANFRELEDLLRREIGVKALIAGSNHWENHTLDLVSNAQFDFIDRHKYWDHPAGGIVPTSAIVNAPMTRRMDSGDSIIVANARQRVAGRPFVVTEWNFCWPNDFIAEGPLLAAAYGSFQNWNGLLEFHFGLPRWRSQMAAVFDAGDKPHFIAGLPAASLAYRRGDVRAGVERRWRPSETDVYGELGAAIPGEVFLRERVAAVLPAASAGEPLAAQEAAPGEIVCSATGELSWHREGLVTVDTPRTQGFAGFPEQRQVDLGDVSITLDNPFAEIVVTSLSDEPIAQAKHLLISASARAENRSQVYRALRMSLVDVGKKPILVEPVSARIVLRRVARTAPRVYAVDWYGRRTPVTLPVEKDAGPADAWSLRLGSQPYSWFEAWWE
jgi:hypothetical protein